ESQLPKTLQVTVDSVANIDDYEQPLKVEYSIKGSLGTVTGKRLVLPVDVFVMEDKPVFPHATRTQAVYFHYPELVRDATRINFPAGMTVEAAPASSTAAIKGRSAYSLDITSAPTSITVRRSFAYNDIIFNRDEYPELRNFYSQLETKDHDSVVLKSSATAPAASTPAGGN
ncbi:MAG: transglutaminase, partial [Bryocella sp.]